MKVFLQRISFFALTLLVTCYTGVAATYTLTINTNGNGTVARNPTNSVYPNGSVVTLTALPASGWSFSSWSGDASGTNNPLNVTMDSNKVITANFSQISNYTLTINISGSGSVAPPGGIFQSNTVVSLAATPSNGWAFHHWSGDASSGTNPLNVTMNTNKDITAVFFQPLFISSHPGGGSVNIGSSFSFSVSATGSAALTYQWLFNNVALPDATAATLTLSNVQPANGGDYQVIISNPYGTATSVVAVVTVNCPGTNVVSVASDSALRTAIAIGGTVRLCFGGTITLTNTINITKDLTLDASGTSVIVSGGNAVRLFNVSTGVSFVASNLVFADGLHLGTNGADATGASVAQNGEPAAGGAIYNAGGFVRLISCVLSNNQAQGGDGGSGNSTWTTNAAGADAAGGAIYNAGGTLNLQNVAALNNRARGGHGGIYTGLIFISFYGGGGSAIGGALCNSGGTMHIVGGVFTSNSASAAAGKEFSGRPIASGGVAYQNGGSMAFSNVMFLANNSRGSAAENLNTTPLNNPANADGGAICVGAGFATFDHVQFIGNSAKGGNSFRGSGVSFGNGGALVNRGTVVIGFSTISSNNAVAGSGGGFPLSALGGALLNHGTSVVHATTFDHNAATGGSGGGWGSPTGWPGGPGVGGAVFNGDVFRGTNLTIALNQARGGSAASGGQQAGNAHGGGIYNTGIVELVNVTMVTNIVVRGFGMNGFVSGANIANSNGTLNLKNSLVAGADTNGNVWGTVIDSGFNISSDGSANFSSGSSFNFTDPKLLPLANNGGPTLTMALRADSPAIDFGTASGAPMTDQRGVVRPHGAGVDIGAFEVGPLFLPLSGQRSGSMLNLSFDGAAGLSYRIERSADVLTWELQEATGIRATDGVVLRMIPLTGPKQFFRLSLDF